MPDSSVLPPSLQVWTNTAVCSYAQEANDVAFQLDYHFFKAVWQEKLSRNSVFFAFTRKKLTKFQFFFKKQSKNVLYSWFQAAVVDRFCAKKQANISKTMKLRFFRWLCSFENGALSHLGAQSTWPLPEQYQKVAMRIKVWFGWWFLNFIWHIASIFFNASIFFQFS